MRERKKGNEIKDEKYIKGWKDKNSEIFLENKETKCERRKKKANIFGKEERKIPREKERKKKQKGNAIIEGRDYT